MEKELSLTVIDEGRCTGHCCRQFTLPFSPEEMIKINSLGGTNPQTRAKFIDWDKIFSMVIYLGSFTRQQMHDLQRGFFPIGKNPDAIIHTYTCKHLNRESGNCMNYENRPNLCRGYPSYGQSESSTICEYKDCTWKKYNWNNALKILGEELKNEGKSEADILLEEIKEALNKDVKSVAHDTTEVTGN